MPLRDLSNSFPAITHRPDRLLKLAQKVRFSFINTVLELIFDMLQLQFSFPLHLLVIFRLRHEVVGTRLVDKLCQLLGCLTQLVHHQNQREQCFLFGRTGAEDLLFPGFGI